MFASKSTSRSWTARPGWNRFTTRVRRSERTVTRAVKAVAESLERRMLLSASASMVADINVTTGDSSLGGLEDLGNGKIVFIANDGYHGQEPWVSDGTAAGTSLIKDINPGLADSTPRFPNRSPYYQNEVVANGRLFFGATDGTDGNELWITDGTPAGTTLVKDINPGSADSNPYEMVAVGNTIFFVANDGTDGPQLWKSDGTPAGTSMVTTIGTSQNPNIQLGPVFNGRLFFSADDGVHGDELWSTDGTAAGTAMFMDINPGQTPSNPVGLTVSGSQLFFVANDGTDGTELWVTDGTQTGTHLVSDLAPGGASSILELPTDVNGTLYIQDVVGSADDLYKSDGTSAGTVLVYSFSNSSAIHNLIDYGGRLYFVPIFGAGHFQLWQTDGTTDGTTEVADLEPGVTPNFLGMLTVAGSNLFFAADTAGGRELFVITSVGAAPTAISPAGVGIGAAPQFLAVGSGVYFVGVSVMTNGELWHSDGTANGTAIVDDVNQITNGSMPGQVTDINGHGVFAANDTVHGTELWVTDGSAGGTTLLKDIVPGSGDGLAQFTPVRLGNYYYFVAGAGRGQIWRTDGTASGTTLCLSYLPASRDPVIYPGVAQLTSINGSLYFFADDGAGSALYMSDGTPGGTTRLRYMSHPVGTNADAGSQFSVVGNEVIFAGTDSYWGTEPWITDDTFIGTVLLMDINPGSASSLNGLQRFVNLGPFVYFTAQSQSGMAIWKSNGTSAGTSIVKDFSPINIWGLNDLTLFNGKLYFSTYVGSSSASGGDLWASDGTANGTVLIQSFPNNNGGGAPSNLTVVGNTLFFSASPSASSTSQQLFASDGTTAGTILVPGAGPVQAGSSPGELTNVQGTLYFTAEDQAGVAELWRVDQSPQGALSMEDIWPTARNLAAVDGTLFFQGADQAHGVELWKLNLLQANAGGPYLATGSTVQFDASASRDPNPSYPLTYSWDLDGDGIFGETGTAAGAGNETGVNPTFFANQVGPGIFPVTVQVTGSWQNTASAASYVTVPPHAEFAGDTLTFRLGSAVANASIQSWTINWGDGTPVENYAGSITSVSHLFATASGANPFMVQVSAVGASGSVQPLPMPVTVYPDPVLNNGSLYLTGTSGSDVAVISNAGGEFDVGLNGADRIYNSSLISHFFYGDGGGDDQIILRDSFLATLNLSTGNDWITNTGATAIVNPGTGKIRLDASSSTTTFTASSGSGIRQVQLSNINISGNAKVVFANTSSTLGDYSNHANRTLAIVDAGGLDISSGATLDLGDNSMLLKYAPADKTATDTMVNSLLDSGADGGAWDGTGLTSSEANYDAFNGAAARAVGWADQQDVGVVTFEGDTTDVADGNEIMIKFTYYGDTDLDGKVAASDSTNFSTGVHLTGNAFWEFGDFDYSGGKPTASDSQSFSTGLDAYKRFGQL